MNHSLSLVTALSPVMGYDLASQFGKQADTENKSLKQILEEKGLLTEEVERLLNPKGMV